MSKPLCFTKMHGIGNDFVIINCLKEIVDINKLSIKALADRHIGIGFDQLLLIEPSKHADFFCRIFNADGSQAEQCGNGLRCVARYIHEEKLCPKNEFTLETLAGIFPIEIENYDHIRVTLGVPEISEALFDLKLNKDFKPIPVSILSVGNPHAIINLETHLPLVDELGPLVSTHPVFPNGANVGFMQILNRKHIKLRTFERGVGETFACGSNAAAAVCAGIINGWLDKRVTVSFPYGDLTIEWAGENNSIQMTGPAAKSFTGELHA